MNILITNDDGYKAKGIHVLADMMRQFGSVTVIAPKKHQSGMSMAVSMGLRPIAHKVLSDCDGMTWSYLDGTPATCVKFALNTIFLENRPDVVVSGINHGSNAATASCYSGTLGAAEEAALNDIPAIGVSLDSINPDADFSAVREFFPDMFRKIMASLPSRHGIYYNINFPDIPSGQIKGIRVGSQGMGKWIREFYPWDPGIFARHGITPELLGQTSEAAGEEGETIYVMGGEFLDDPRNGKSSDHHLLKQGYISITAHNVDCTDYVEYKRLETLNFNTNY